MSTMDSHLSAGNRRDAAGIVTRHVGWSVEGPDLASLARELRALPSVEQIAAFGGRLHVVGRDADKMTVELAPFQANARYKWEPVQPGLEDVFIHLMRNAKDESVANKT